MEKFPTVKSHHEKFTRKPQNHNNEKYANNLGTKLDQGGIIGWTIQEKYGGEGL